MSIPSKDARHMLEAGEESKHLTTNKEGILQRFFPWMMPIPFRFLYVLAVQDRQPVQGLLPCACICPCCFVLRNQMASN